MSEIEGQPPVTGAKRLVELLAVVAFYLYLGGWVYANDILAAFGLNLGLLDVPAYYFIVYSYTVFFTSIGGWLLLLGIAGGWYALSRFRFVLWAELVLAVVIATVPFPVVRLLARSQAEVGAAQIRSGKSKFVTFVPRTGATNKYSDEFLAVVSSGKLFLILSTKERYFVVLQPRIPGNVLPVATTYDVPVEDFVAMIELDEVRRAP